MAAPALAMRGLVKDFAGVRALDHANLVVERGTVHGLIGQNGAGKSTLSKILAGIYAPDQGSIALDGRELSALTPHRAEQLGIHFIHQDRLLVPTLTVSEALFLGGEITRAGVLDRRRMRRQARAALQDWFGIDLPPDRLIGELSPAQQQIVQITRALLRSPAMLVFDEPTAALMQREVKTLFAIISRLRQQGITSIYISHYLQEIRDICDAVTVLRNGCDVGTVDARGTPTATLISMMVSRDLGEMFPRTRVAPGPALLEAHALSAAGRFHDVSFTVRRGEIVGLTGLVGSGAKDVMRCLFGLEQPGSGAIRYADAPARLRSPVAAVTRGMALVPEDRRGHGIAPGMSVRHNVSLASLGRYGRRLLIDRRAERRDVARLVEELAVKTPGLDTPVRNLSGGNQQKLVLAKWLSRQSGIYLLDEPTVGVDVGAKTEIYRLVGRLAEQGAGVLVLSADLLELLGLCDRILVMFRGRIVYQSPAAATDSDTLLLHATAGSQVTHAA